MPEKQIESVYAMLGFPDPEGMALKARLASKISEIILEGGLTQAYAAALIGTTQPKLSNLLRGKFRGVSVAKMMECITALGNDIEIIIKPAPRSRAAHVAMRSPQRRKAVATTKATARA